MLMPFIWHASCQASLQASFPSFVLTAMVSRNGTCVTIRQQNIEVAVIRMSLESASKSPAFIWWWEPFEFFWIFTTTVASSVLSSHLVTQGAGVCSWMELPSSSLDCWALALGWDWFNDSKSSLDLSLVLSKVVLGGLSWGLLIAGAALSGQIEVY